MLVYKLFLTVKESYQNTIYSSFSLAKRLMALAEQDNTPLVKEILFIGLLILMNNIKQTEEEPREVLLNSIPIHIDNYNLIKEVKIPE